MHRTTLQDEVARSWEGASPHEWQWGRVRVSPSRFLGWYGSSRIKASAEDMGVYMVSMLDPMTSRLGLHLHPRRRPELLRCLVGTS